MAFDFNGNIPRNIKFNNKYVKKLKYNNQIVWEKKLPDEYQEVEYLSMSNGPKINTDLTATQSQNTVIEIIAQSISSSEAPTARKLVAVSDGSGNFFGDNNGFWVASGVNTQISALDKTKIRLSFTKTLDIEIGDQKWSASRSASGSGNVLKLFKTSTSYRGLVGKCFGCKIWQENQLVRDYVCCYRKLDNEPGLYDLANDVFYTNEGTGEFTVGEDI